MTENEEYLYNHFLISLKSGLISPEDIVDETIELAEEERFSHEISEDWIRTSIMNQYEALQQKSTTWNHPTDTEKLKDVFDALCRQKIIALHNAGYTTEDAVYDAQDLWEDLEDNGLHPIGYCYYHGQDLERVIESGELMIGFDGKHENNDKEAIAIGQKVVAELQKAGFNVSWNGSRSKRIAIEDFDWKNVFVSDADVEANWGYDRVFDKMNS